MGEEIRKFGQNIYPRSDKISYLQNKAVHYISVAVWEVQDNIFHHLQAQGCHNFVVLLLLHHRMAQYMCCNCPTIPKNHRLSLMDHCKIKKLLPHDPQEPSTVTNKDHCKTIKFVCPSTPTYPKQFDKGSEKTMLRQQKTILRQHNCSILQTPNITHYDVVTDL